MDISIDAALEHVLFLARHFAKDDFASVARMILLELRIPSGREGFRLLCKGLEALCETPDITYMNVLYEKIAPGSSYFAADQAVRSALRIGWRDGTDAKWDLYFPPDKHGVRKCPSNSEFITKLALILELRANCCEEVHHEVV